MPGFQVGAEDSVFPYNWTFLQTPDGKILLAARAEMGLVPVFVFHTYEHFEVFRDDVVKAVGKFKSKSSGVKLGFQPAEKEESGEGLPGIQLPPY